jgi:two-component system sensor histidine kinase ChiS
MDVPNCDVFVVDDEPDTVLLAKKLLELGKFKVQTATSGEEALDLISKRKVFPRLILLDIMMPNGDGWFVLEKLKRDEALKSIKVIIFTVKQFTKDSERAKSLGADGYITKPFRGEKLLQYVREKIGQ